MQTETDKEKLETEILKHQEKFNMIEVQFANAGKEKDNLQSEMEILLDRISKLTEMVEKTRVWKKYIHLQIQILHILAVFVILWAENHVQLNCNYSCKLSGAPN